jgi:hypothetical protein
MGIYNTVIRVKYRAIKKRDEFAACLPELTQPPGGHQ